jgi:Protein of unknown function (DUF3352)
MLKTRLLIILLVTALATVAAGCSEGGSSSSTGANFAAPESLVYVEAKLNPSGTLKSNVDALAEKIGGIDNLGDYIVSQLEGAAQEDGETLDFAQEVQPWLGGRAGIAFKQLEENGELDEPLIAIETTNPAAAQRFVDERVGQSNEPFRSGSYEAADFEVGGAEGNAIGVVDDFLLIADGERQFKDAVDASQGDSLADEDGFEETISAASNASIADVYVDVGGLIDEGEDKIDSQTLQFLESTGVNPTEATAVASVVPGADQIEIDVSGDLGGKKAPTGDASELLDSLPGSSLAAFAVSGFREQVEEAIDDLDASGIPPDLPPNQLKSTLNQAGIDLDSIAASVQDAALFVEGSSRSNLGGALVLATDGSSEAKQVIGSIGILLRSARIAGVTALGGGTSGFSIRSPELGDKPVVVAAKGSQIVIGYGLPQALAALDTGAALEGSSAYEAAVSSLGKTPISGFADGPAALLLAEALVPRSKTEFWEAVPYLKKIRFIAVGRGVDDELATARVIAGLK